MWKTQCAALSLFHQSVTLVPHQHSPQLLSGCRFKQRGEAAVAADNVFHHLTYEGAVDVEGMADKQHRAALESQINEFGQCPRSAPHPLYCA